MISASVFSPDRELEFEAASAAADLVSRFDAARDAFDFPKNSEFWFAVERAHADGCRGAGRRIAVIDSAFDLRLARLRDRAGGGPQLSAAATHGRAHGTAVALLITEVAPEARLDLYEVSRGAKPDVGRVVRAIDAASQSEVSIINLSIGHKLEGDGAGHACPIEGAVRRAVARGKVVVTSAGNYFEARACPAHVGGTVSVGLQNEERRIVPTPDGVAEVGNWREPGFSQSLFPTFTIPQPPGVLGSSFAAPLAAGLAALAHDPREMIQFRDSVLAGAIATELTNAIVDGQLPLTEESARFIEEQFTVALRNMPRHPGPLAHPCPACAFLTSWIYTNAGRFYIGAQPTVLDVARINRADLLLRQAAWLAPWSVEAKANLGKVAGVKARVLFEGGVRGERIENLLTEACGHYEAALEGRPGDEVFETELARIQATRATLE